MTITMLVPVMSERELFLAALDLVDLQARAAYLDQACSGDDALRAKVDVMLKSYEEACSSILQPAAGVFAATASATPLTANETVGHGESGPAASVPTPFLLSTEQTAAMQPDSLDETCSGGLQAGTRTAPAPVTLDGGDRRTGLELGSIIAGRYKLVAVLGEGGMGTVYRANQTVPVKRDVALKLIKAGMDSHSVLARFDVERQALALMDHPNIARVYDGGTTPAGQPYFVMELVTGAAITEYCDQERLSVKARLKLFISVCQAVQHAHQKGIIHRDLKPGNVLVKEVDGLPTPKVIDFGVAKATVQKLTEQTMADFRALVGTPAYMSPEQADPSSIDIDTRTDVYALGVILYELLAGSPPIGTNEVQRGAILEMLRMVREVEPERPSTRVRTAEGLPRIAANRGIEPAKLSKLLRGDLDWVVLKALEKDRTRRYDTATGFAADIRRYLADEPVVARPPSTGYRFRKAWRRNRLAFTAAAAVAMALLAGIGVSTWQADRANRAKAAALAAQADALVKQSEAETQRNRADLSQQQSRQLLYASNMNLAQQALKLNNLGKARRLLDRHRPQPGEEDLRGWEWRYLWQQTRSRALVTLTNRPTRGSSVSFSRDGNRLAVGWFDGHVDLWDVPGRRWIRALTDSEQAQEGRVAFAPVRNFLAATSEPNSVTLYDLDSGRESILWRAPDRGTWDVRDLAFSQDGSKMVIYAGSNPSLGDAVWVVDVFSSKTESRHPTAFSRTRHHGAAQLSPDNRRLYMPRSDALNYRYSIQCIDLSTGQELWQTERQRDLGLTALAISPDGRVLASGSGFEDPSIRIWDATTGRLLVRLDGHTAWVCRLAFSKDGHRLISAASDQTLRIWDTSAWTETQVLRGHSDEVHAVAISEQAHLVASAGKDGNLMLWKEDWKSTADGYIRLPENLRDNEVLPLDHSRALLLSPGKPPELVDLKGDSPPMSLPEIGSSSDVLGWFGPNLLCHWNGTNQILVRELQGTEFIQRGSITIDSGMRPTGAAYNSTRWLLAWTEESFATSVYLADLARPGRRIELRSDVPGLVPYRFFEDGNHLAAVSREGGLLRVWNVETEQIVVSIDSIIREPAFAARERVLVVCIRKGQNYEIVFFDLAHPDRALPRVRIGDEPQRLAVSPDGRLVALSSNRGLVRLFDPARGELIETLHAHQNAALGLAFSADGRRLISAFGGREAVKLWDVGTRQELLTLAGTGSTLDTANWSADGDVILAGAPWQAWRAPSWGEITAAEAKDKMEIAQP